MECQSFSKYLWYQHTSLQPPMQSIRKDEIQLQTEGGINHQRSEVSNESHLQHMELMRSSKLLSNSS